MTRVTKLYQWIKNLKTPAWLKYLLNDIIKPLLLGISKQVYETIKYKIVYASEKDWTNQQKFDYVFGEVSVMFGELGENLIRLAIEAIVAQLKKTQRNLISPDPQPGGVRVPPLRPPTV